MANNPTLLAMPLAENGQKNTIPATQAAAGNGLLSQSTGFPPETALPLGAGGKAPTREDFNGAFNLLGGVAFYAQKGWTFKYDATQAYYKGCVVIDPADGNRYECIADMPAGTIAPSADTGKNYWKGFLDVPIVVSPGMVFAYAGGSIPSGYLLCDGSAVSRSTYSSLFSAIGTTYGGGDGSTTFNLPYITDGRFLEGSSTAGTKHNAGLPDIIGQLSRPYSGNGNAGTGAFSGSTGGKSLQIGTSGTTLGPSTFTFNASNSNSIYGSSTTVQPKSLTTRYIIRYE